LWYTKIALSSASPKCARQSPVGRAALVQVFIHLGLFGKFWGTQIEWFINGLSDKVYHQFPSFCISGQPHIHTPPNFFHMSNSQRAFK
jgi:hypothetical protein